MYTKCKIVPFYPCHFVRTILSNTILLVYHFVQYHFARIQFCPLPFCPRTSGSISCSAMWIFHDILLYNLSVLKLEQIRLLLTGKFICYYDRGRAQKSV